MRIRNLFLMIIAVVLCFTLASCLDSDENYEDETKITYDDNGNISRIDHYDDEGNIDGYVIFGYDEKGVIEIKTAYDKDGVKLGYAEYSYYLDGNMASEDMVSLDAQGNQVDRFLTEYTKEGVKSKETRFNANNDPEMISIFNEAGNCIISEDYSYDENGVFLGRHLIEHTAEMLAIREEYYDAENNLKQKNTYSYGDNGIMTENKQVNGNGEIIYHTVCDENGNETYRESNSFHENGKMSVKDKTEIKDGVTYQSFVKYDESGKEIYREYTESINEKVIRNEKYDADGKCFYFKDALQLQEKLFDDEGIFAGWLYIEYYENGEMKTVNETNAIGMPTATIEYSESGVALKEEVRVYDDKGMVIEHSYEERRENDILVTSSRIEYDENGKIINRSIANYDEYENVILSEEIKNYVLVSKTVAEYYGKEQIKREELYQLSGNVASYRVTSFDEEGRELERYDRDQELEGNILREEFRKYRYNSAGIVVYEESKDKNGDVSVKEYYDDGTLKTEENTMIDGKYHSYSEYNESGELIGSNSVGYDDNGNKTTEIKNELVDGVLVSSRDQYIYSEDGVLERLLHEGYDGASITEYYPSGKISAFHKYADEHGKRQLYSEGYDEDGNLKGRSEYDENNNLVYTWQLKEDGEEISRYENMDIVYYECTNSDGRVVKEFYPRNQLKKSSEYNTAGQLLRYDEYYENGQSKLSVSYDENGNPLSRIEWNENGEPIE